MRHAIGGLAALLLGAGLLLLGHGMLTTLLAVRGEIEGFGAGLIGGIGTAYYLGFFSGCVLLPPLMRRVGHIRMFAAAGALVLHAGAGLVRRRNRLAADPLRHRVRHGDGVHGGRKLAERPRHQ